MFPMKNVLKALLALALFSLLFGCINLNDDSLQKMNLIMQKYSTTDSYLTNQATMTDYITDLADLKKSASNENAKIIQAEIYLAESFNYQNKAQSESTKVNYIYLNCTSKEAKAMINYLNLAFNSINLAEKTYNELNEGQKDKLRSNYSELLVGYKEQITLMKTFVESKC